jgi:hypothetical protein
MIAVMWPKKMFLSLNVTTETFYLRTVTWLVEIVSYLKSRRLCNAENKTRDTAELLILLFVVCGHKSSPRTDFASSLGTG